MGWSIGYDPKWKRHIGYGVPSICDRPGCEERIDRGLGYVCGAYVGGGEHGCGLFFCGKHLFCGEDAFVCERCLDPDGLPFEPKPDTLDWVKWKLNDPSWAQWREKNKEEVGKMLTRVENENTD